MNLDAETSRVDPALLLHTAHRLFDDHDLRPSVVMAQTAVEVATENLLGAAFEARGVDDLRDPILALFTSFSLKNKRLFALYQSLTRDDLKKSEPALWKDFCAHIDRRNDIVHTGKRVSTEEAKASVDVAERMVEHLQDVLAKLESRAGERASDRSNTERASGSGSP